MYIIIYGNENKDYRLANNDAEGIMLDLMLKKNICPDLIKLFYGQPRFFKFSLERGFEHFKLRESSRKKKDAPPPIPVLKGSEQSNLQVQKDVFPH